MVLCDSVRIIHLLLRSVLTMMIVRVTQMSTLLRDVTINTFILARALHITVTSAYITAIESEKERLGSIEAV